MDPKTLPTHRFTQVHLCSEASERMRALTGARERLIRMCKDLEGHVRGVLKVFGICMTSVATESCERLSESALSCGGYGSGD